MVSHRWTTALVAAGAMTLVIPATTPAQGTSGPTVSDSRVGYIDPAIPGTLFRLRYDAAYNNRRPTRAEFFYPKGAPAGPGLREPEPSVDFQDISAYLEVQAADRLSGFVEVPVRFLNPERNPNSAGLSDVSAGFKYAFIWEKDFVATLQLRAWAPSGDSDRGLGTHHATVEPGLLLYDRLSDRLAGAAELRTWVPIDGTDFAGTIIRYGVGLHYDVYRSCDFQLTPVAEFVGWTVLDGKTTVVPPDGAPFVQDAAGQTIVNAKLGVRALFGDRADIYAGYGRPLTGNRWYENIFRLEFRLLF